jgi:flagellin-like hook-associated protein FlgL
MTFTPGELGEGDTFSLHVVPGKYLGDGTVIEFNNNMFSRVNINVTGQALFEDSGLFDTLYRLRNALGNGNNIEISDALGTLETIQSDIQGKVTTTGIELNRLEITKNNLMMLQENVLENIQNIERMDTIELLSRFAMAENALNSSIAALSKVFPPTLLNYI